MKILTNLQNISLSFGDKTIFDKTSFDIKENEKIGLIGLNGKGKSTLLRIINEDISPDSSSPPFIFDKMKNLKTLYIPQELSIENLEHKDISKYYLNFYPDLSKIALELEKIEQKLMTNTENMDQLIHNQSNLLQKFEDLNGWQIEQSYLSYLKKFNFDDHAKELSLLSGGEKRKIALSIGLSAPHNLILWDEPTNHLDIETIEKFEDELKIKNTTFIMISHDRYILSTICDKIIHLNRGKIEKFNGNYLDYIVYQEAEEKNRQEQMTKLKNTHRRELAWMRQGIKARGTRSKKRVENFNNIESNIQNLKDLKKKRLDLNLSHSNRKTKILLSFENASFSYENKVIFKESNLELYKGDRVALIGSNGSGKSTLLKIIIDELQISFGKLKKTDALEINYFSQNRSALDLSKTPFEIIGDGQDMIHLPNGQAIHINSYLDKFLFSSSEIRRPISTLSGGEKNRLQLALFMKKSADLWIFDEPTNDLDIETIETLENSLIEYEQAVIIVSHDRAFLDKVTTKSWIFKNQEILEFGGNYSDNAQIINFEEDKKALKKEISHSDINNKDKKALSNKEKIRLETIEPEIEKEEEILSKIQTLMEGHDFTNGSIENSNLYQEYEKRLKKVESKLESLMIEWEELNLKANS